MIRYTTYLFIFLNVFGFSAVHSQVLDSLSFDTAYVYSDLKEALKNPDEIYRLSLRKLKLKTIPEDVYRLKNLNELDLGKNNIKELSGDIIKLSYLQKLNLERNQLETLPKEIGALKNLKQLILNQNQIYTLPWEMGDLEKLEYIDLWSNNISELPKTMKKLTNLKRIDMRVISLNQEQQDALKNLFPDVIFDFSPACNCGK